MTQKQIIVLSDVHANIGAYKKGLSLARRIGFDKLINLGDLLTYGCDAHEVIDETLNAVENDNMILIKGNHDQLYFDIMQDDFSYYNSLPVWIQESIDWTIKQTGLEDFEKDLPWRNHYNTYNIYFAHANPFKYGDWRYLNSKEVFIQAACAMNMYHGVIGIFGHTHRHKIVSVSLDQKCQVSKANHCLSTRLLGQQLAVLINSGAVGQPRNSEKTCTILVLTIQKNNINVKFVKIPNNYKTHISKIKRTSLTNETKQKLINYFLA